MATIIPSLANVDSSGLKLTISNVLIDQVPAIIDAGVNEVPANISDPDHSLNYTCGTDSADFSVSYGAQQAISYIAISGHNAATQAAATVEIYNGGLLLDSATLTRNHNLMFTFPLQTFVDLIVKFVTAPTTYQTTVSYISAGEIITIQSGEQSGYKRQWLNRHTTQRTTTNLQVMPTSTTTQNKSLKGVLSLPNMLSETSQGLWQTFIDFAYEQPFFIKEVKDKPESSYICFDPRFDTSAHSQTRKLDVIKLNFTLFNGL